MSEFRFIKKAEMRFSDIAYGSFEFHDGWAPSNLGEHKFYNLSDVGLGSGIYFFVEMVESKLVSLGFRVWRLNKVNNCVDFSHLYAGLALQLNLASNSCAIVQALVGDAKTMQSEEIVVEIRDWISAADSEKEYRQKDQNIDVFKVVSKRGFL